MISKERTNFGLELAKAAVLLLIEAGAEFKEEDLPLSLRLLKEGNSGLDCELFVKDLLIGEGEDAKVVVVSKVTLALEFFLKLEEEEEELELEFELVLEAEEDLE